MPDKTDHGRKTIDSLAQAHGLTPQAVEQMAGAMLRGGGTMAQFDVAELGGSGQWMAGGMTMVGDMFNSSLKVRVESLCNDLAQAMAEAPLFSAPKHVAASNWWPAGLGQPSSVGGQNQVRYAYFPQARRIAFDPGTGGDMILLDTLDHQIGGFGQQQSGPGDPFAGISFSSQNGQFALASLPRVGAAGEAAKTPEPHPGASPGAVGPEAVPARAPDEIPVPGAAPGPTAVPFRQDPLDVLEKLGKLRDAGILTEEEFSRKKAEILSRI